MKRHEGVLRLRKPFIRRMYFGHAGSILAVKRGKNCSNRFLSIRMANLNKDFLEERALRQDPKIMMSDGLWMEIFTLLTARLYYVKNQKFVETY